ncbi:MAG: rod shape-determining protein RodA [Alphaproteobacteria bacterium]
MFDRRLIINFDFFLLAAVLLLSFFGVLNLKSIYSSSSESVSLYYYKQSCWIFFGLLILLISININYTHIIRYAYFIHFVSVFVLFCVLIMGQTKLGSQRWIYLGPLSLQPSEFAKITFILALSKFFSENISQKPYGFRDFFFPLIILLSSFFPVFFQPDLGTAGIFFIVFLSIIFFVNIQTKKIYSFLIILILILPCFWFTLENYQKKRITVFLNPELDPLNAGYQAIQSKIAIGSGGVFGKGYKMGTQSKLRFLPEQHTDFVFSVWAEEWGFFGCLFILSLFFFILYRSISISYNSKTFSGSFLGIGITSLFFWQFAINIFMTLGLFPVVGVTFPFFSYGGSSIVSSFIGIGFILNINMSKFK